MDKAFAVIANS